MIPTDSAQRCGLWAHLGSNQGKIPSDVAGSDDSCATAVSDLTHDLYGLGA
jgi:hypothetical protein